MAALAIEDILLIDRCVGGEDSAARELFRRHQRRVHATLYRILGSNQDMDDLVQDTFIQVFQSLAGFRGEALLATWIDRIAVRVAYRHIGKRKRLPVPIETEALVAISDPRDGPAEIASARAGIGRLYEALNALSPTLRIAFVLFSIDGRSVAEIAQLLGTTETTAKVRIWRARRGLDKSAAKDPVLAELLSTNSGARQ